MVAKTIRNKKTKEEKDDLEEPGFDVTTDTITD